MAGQIKTYNELMKFSTFEDRFNYLKLDGKVGSETFGLERYLNQLFYKNSLWLDVRNEVIVRDNGCDLAIPEMEILSSKIIVHHLNPITIEDIVNRSDTLLNPDFLITTSLHTHNAIHYGDIASVKTFFPDRRPNDTCPWKR